MTNTLPSDLAGHLRSSEPFARLREACRAQRTIEIDRLPSPAAAWVFEVLGVELQRGVVAVVPRESDALAWLESARLLAGTAGAEPGGTLVYLPAPSLSPYQETEASLLGRTQVALALDTLASADRPTVVLTPRALFRRVPKLEGFAAAVRTLREGDEISLQELALHLVRHGYRRTDLVAEVGAFAIRGGVFDVFPPGGDEPVRLDLYGDEIESIRTFDSVTQRSLGRIREVRLLPLSPFPAAAEDQVRLAARLREELSPPADSEAAQRIDALLAGEGFPGWESYLPLVDPDAISVADLLGDALWVAVEPSVLLDEARHHGETLWHDFAVRQGDDRLAVPPARLAGAADEIESRLRRVGVRVQAEPVTAPPDGAVEERIDFAGGLTDRLVGQLPRFPRELETARDRGERLLLVAPAAHHARLADLLEGRGMPTGPGAVELCDGELRRGFRLAPARVVVFSEAQLFARGDAPDRGARPRRSFVRGLGDLRIGEYVVHEDHGIGQFVGMRALSVGGDSAELPPALRGMRETAVTSEVMEIVYASGRTLLLPIDRLDQIQRYSGLEGVAPRLDQLGGTSWTRKKTRVKKGLQKLAVDLLRLYAERQLARAPAAREDSDAQSQFEAAFAFDETPDQLAAAQAVKADLERELPMDRLLVGDVGFGKTEVAMRAAFKMVDSGYQVAVLAPTTILADQHLQTFRDRFAGFPVEVEMVSRFRSPAEMREIRKRLAEGKIDVIVGTHKLLGRDIEIPRLGLLVVDEEQRFGVAHKERLKDLRRNIHVLAMSATPVPRTLQLSLAGVRELSTIESPPKDRMAVETRIVAFSEELVREAIEFELERGGQVYYVYNRVEDIERVSAWLRELLPGLRLTVGHGQLEERELLRRMHAFKGGEVDLLLATTIIENGIDIPRVNTMLVHGADRFGLAQLYQLRGRVGRSNQLAFCYLLLPSDHVLSEVARKRLQSLREFSELGAGFRVAARDLEIRGAGNLLGAEQSGNIAELGIETYLKMLEDTVRELRGETLEDTPSAHIDLPVSMTIPSSYLSEPNLRMEVYQRLAREDPRELLAELRDRFGPPPRAVETLAEVAELKRLAERLRVQSVAAKGGRLDIRLRRDARVDVELLIELVSEREGSSFSPNGVLRFERVPAEECLAVARGALERIALPAAVGPGAQPAAPVSGAPPRAEAGG
ncbi:MAG TPA: transcription-repair coupling factor [Thermoanaerobaculia bacterium]|nr:transcription-repair coupling factor [Thermoanaerobaculia bacterium]